MSDGEVLRRWRLALGRHARRQLNPNLDRRDARMERALDFLYDRARLERGERLGASLDATQLTVPHWLEDVRELFPKDAYERVQSHALDRFGMSELLRDPEVLANLEPSAELLQAVLSFKGAANPQVLEEIRRLVRRVVEDVRRRIETDVLSALTGRRNRFRRGHLKAAQNFDWQGTIRANLKNADPQSRRIVFDRLLFHSRVRRHLPWRVVLCVDQSGSMFGSLIHAAVMAGILAGLPTVRPSLVLFDTSIVDLSQHVDDPVEIMLSVQLGGGTDIGKAVSYCETKIEEPRRTIFVLISDFCEGGSPRNLLASVKRMKEAGVVLLGLASLDEGAAPYYDQAMAQRLAACGMEIAALTPQRFAAWLAERLA